CDEMRQHYPRLRERLTTIQNGVDTEFFAPGRSADDARALRAELNIAQGCLVALFVGSEWEGKGLAPLISALASAPGWELLVVGSGPIAQAAAWPGRARVGVGFQLAHNGGPAPRALRASQRGWLSSISVTNSTVRRCWACRSKVSPCIRLRASRRPWISVSVN